MKVIALITDFGLKDNFVGVMKGVMLAINPKVQLVDITHQIISHQVQQAAFLLLKSYSYFPKGTVFGVVVDPGVGSKRKALALKTKNYYFVGPDNGVLYPAACDDGIKKIVCLDKKKYFLNVVTKTFQGRDIFAPVAAYLSKNIKISSLGKPLKRIKTLVFPNPRIKKNTLHGEILYVDRFGNLVTNIKKKDFLNFTKHRKFIGSLNGKIIKSIYNFYEEAPKGKPFFIEGSFGLLEISLKKKSALKHFRIKSSRKITVRIFK